MASDGFTAADLEAADHLVQLGGGGGDAVDEDDRAEASSSSSSSTLSVNKAEAVARGPPADETGLMDRRVRKRHRLLADLYAATRLAKDGSGSGSGKLAEEERADAAARGGRTYV
ncbi:hypothetical protein GUJ93_ZPchr0010g9704 [Zizania palustris]|uniref:Uncharacterized protein n=1 Tax=Zizania palustris TaxID=103762 RepID=A0A8J6BMX9_ZIZPA|nr:hypothetical protein GUJ93_ZPchr0010g9704 [Zizania palustris]